jgi:hypothetical protein
MIRRVGLRARWRSRRRPLPQRVMRARRAPGKETSIEESPAAFRLMDIVGLGWIRLAQTPGVEMVLGQASRPWQADASSAGAPTTPEQFTNFDELGSAKIVSRFRADPYGSNSSIMTVETRVVATTGATSCRRFRRC